MLLYAIIFISGGAILALELLASRMMTPYFGVSLYIWTGILSITLVSLALGYWGGGKLAAQRGSAKPMARLQRLFALMPAVAAIAIVGACLAYPHAYAPLANWNLIGGAFAACVLLLFLPLVAASAMNPLLVAILLEGERGGRTGDAGAGRVFFVSTLGSVAGVFVTAFGLIPYVTNFAALLSVAICLALLSLAAVLWMPAPLSGRTLVGAAGGGAAALAMLLLWNADAYTGRQGPFAYGGVRWRVEASYGSLFGTVKVLRTEADGAGDRFLRMYFQDGLTQNVVDSNHRSSSFYTYGLEGLARAYHPKMRSALVLGLGAGMVPMRLAEAGVPVKVVDIDPNAARVARQFFGFAPERVAAEQADARTFVRHCRATYDVAVVDLFHGDGTPDYLVTREFFRDLRLCLADGGIAVFNSFANLEQPSSYAHFLATLKSELPHVVLYRPAAPGAVHVNSFVVASAKPLSQPVKVTFDYVPAQHQDALWDMLSAPIQLTPDLLAGGRIMTDAANPAAYDFAQIQLTYRKTVVQASPPAMLLN